jgi:hypothetical protein
MNYIHTQIHTYTHIYIQIYIYIYTHIHERITLLLKSCMVFKYKGRVMNRYLLLYEDHTPHKLQQYCKKRLYLSHF